MLMCVNVGNSNISIGFFKDDFCDVVTSFKVSSDINKTFDEYYVTIKSISKEKVINYDFVTGVIISSVVPQLTQKIKNVLTTLTKIEPLMVGPGIKTGFNIKIDNPSELGADIVANTAASISAKENKKAIIIADLDSICTVSAVGKNNEYLGCSIFAGIPMSLEALHVHAAQLPNVNFMTLGRNIGKNSQEAICSGVILGSAFAIDGFVEKMALEMKVSPEDIYLVATGEFSEVILKNSKYSFIIEKELILKGLYQLYKNNSN